MPLPWQSFLSIKAGDLVTTGMALSLLAGVAGAVGPAAFLGKALHVLSPNSRVMVTALWGLFAGGVLLLVPVHGGILAAALFTGTFVSMTATEVISPVPFLMLAGAISAMVLWIMRFPFHGYGGLLGASAFVAVFVTYRLEPIRLHIRNRFLQDRS